MFKYISCLEIALMCSSNMHINVPRHKLIFNSYRRFTGFEQVE